MPRPSRFLTVWVVALLVLAGAVAGFNALVDPYDVFGRARIAGFNDIKPRARNHPMLTKTYQIERAKPATVLIGSSRTYVGIDAASPAWPAALKPVYNYAKPELYSAATGFRSLQEAVGTGHLKHAFIFLELQFFLSPDSSMNVDPDDARRYHQTADGAPNPARQTQVMKDMFLSTFSMGALTDSVLTVAGQHRSPTSDIRPDGSALVDDFPRAATAEGEYSLFFQKELSEQNNARGFARDLAPVTAPSRPGHGAVTTPTALSRAGHGGCWRLACHGTTMILPRHCHDPATAPPQPGHCIVTTRPRWCHVPATALPRATTLPQHDQIVLS